MFVGILRRKERWGLSWRGWLLMASIAVIGGYSISLNVYPFLAVTYRADKGELVVEGWVHEYAIQAAAEEFRAGAYQRIFATGGPVAGSGGYINDQNTSASVGAGLLKKAGLPSELVQMVPSHVSGRDRTYSAAVALRDWFRQHDMPVKSINIVTENVHARRTRLLFEKAMGPEVKVGVIAVVDPDYDPRYWWRYSEGVREVIGESVAYIYSRFFFYP
jgi:uncharacterized SAM-binding protein YcdF (DUF218 family)